MYLKSKAKKQKSLERGNSENNPSNSDYIRNPNTGYISELDGSDLITGQSNIQEIFPYLNEKTVAVLHARRCGSMSA